MYSVVAGRGSHGGNTYVAYLVTLYGIRGVNSKTQDIWIATDLRHFDRFNDIVILKEDKESTAKEVYLLKCIHITKPKDMPIRYFFSPYTGTTSFNLQTCCDDYKNITNITSSPDPVVNSFCSTIQEGTNLWCILFTNKGVKEECLAVLEKSDHKFLNTTGEVYKFKYEYVTQMNSSQNNNSSCNEQYLNHLILLSNQIHNKNICALIIDELVKLLHPIKIPRYNLHDIVKKIAGVITEWSRGELGRHYFLTKSHFTTIISEFLLERYMSQFYTNKSNTSSYNFEELDSLINNKNITEINYENESYITDLLRNYFDWLLRDFKPYQKHHPTDDWEQEFTPEKVTPFLRNIDTETKQEMYRTLRTDRDITLYHIYRVLWKVKRIPVVLEVTSRKDYENVLHILSLSEYTLKSIILNTSKSHILATSGIPETFSNIIDLDEGVYNLVLDRTVELQGRPIKLKDLLEKQKNVLKVIGAGDVMQILTSTFKIGSTINKLPTYHVKRTIPRILIDFHLLFEALDYANDMFIVQSYTKNCLFETLNELHICSDKWCIVDYEDVKHMNQIPNNYKIIITPCFSAVFERNTSARNVHLLILHDLHNLEWVATRGSLKTIYSLKRTLTSTSSIMPPVNAQDTLEHFHNQINIISAIPGMGKSVMMNFIAQAAPTDVWVLLVSLNQHLDYYGSEQFKTATADPVKHLRYFNLFSSDNGQNHGSIATEVFTALVNLNSVLILLDGFDEVPQYFRENVTDMIKSFLKSGYKVWLTTRPNLQSYLENEFDTFALNLNSFSSADQLNFLTQYFLHGTENEVEIEESILEFAKQLLQLAQQNLHDWEQEFTAVPLHIRLLVECFEDDCRNYLRTKALNTNFNLLDLYEKFTLKKKILAQEKYGPYCNTTLFDEYHQLFSLQTLFSVDDLEKLNLNSELAKFKNKESEAVDILSKSGIVIKNGLSLDFSHRSFAEYFAAKWLSMNWKKSNMQKLIGKTFQSQYNITRNIFDQLLAENSPLHLAIIRQQIDEARALSKNRPELLNSHDAGGRSPIHLAAAWGIRHPMPKSGEMVDSNIHKCETNSSPMSTFLVEICMDIKEFIQDEVLELTPLNYAVASSSLSNLNAMLSVIKFSSAIAININNVKNYMYYCSRYGYQFIIRRILQTCNPKQLDFYVNTPLDKTLRRSAVHWTSAMGHNNVMELFLFHTAPSKATPQQEKQDNTILNQADALKHTALHLAVENEHSTMVALLLSYGPDINARDQQERTPFHAAAHNGNADILNLLLNGSNINAQDKNGNTALHLTALQGHQNIIFALLEREKNVKKNNNGETALHLATKKEHIDVMQSLLKHNSKIMDECDNNYYTALHVAAEYGHFRAVELLLSLDADQNAKNDENKVALHLAAAYGHKNIVALLIPKIDINIRDGKGNTPLHLAALHNHQSTASELIDHNANIDAQNDLKRTALHVSALKNSKAVASFLLENNINYNQRDESNRTALHLAAMCNSSDIVELLLYRNMNPNDKDVDGNTPLHLAVLKNHLQTIRILLPESNKININEINSDGRTPLHLAAQIGNSVVVELLLSHAANTEITDKNGNSAVNLANINNFSDVSDLFDSTETDMYI